MYHVRTSLAVLSPVAAEHVELVEEHDVPDLAAAEQWADWAHGMGMLADYSEVTASE